MAAEMFGWYRLDSLLGQGGMGKVYRAHDTEQGRDVALKVLPPQLSGDQEYRQRFRREARIAAQLTDPHVVPIHRHGEIDGQLFLEMRLVDGDNLAALLAAGGPLDPESAVRIVEQVGSALDSAHAADLIHRDIKPSNVFLTRPVRPGAPRFAYLGDFGIARAVNSNTDSFRTSTGTTIGTLDYMAPERFLGRDVDARVDVYSLACLLHECLTGTKPFPGTELPALMHGHLSVAPPSPSRRAGVPIAFDGVVARGMAKEPDQRYRTAGDLAMAARAALAAGSPPAPPVARPVGPSVAPTRIAPTYNGPAPGPADTESVRAGSPRLDRPAPRRVERPKAVGPPYRRTSAAEHAQTPATASSRLIGVVDLLAVLVAVTMVVIIGLLIVGGNV